jgi:hypothetical protein
MGQKVFATADRWFDAGIQTFNLDNLNFQSGVYFLWVTTNSIKQVKSFVVNE